MACGVPSNAVLPPSAGARSDNTLTRTPPPPNPPPPQGCITTAVHRRKRGLQPLWTPFPLPSPLLPFQCLRVTAKILLRRLRHQEDLSVKFFGPPSVGTIGGPKEEGSQQPPPPLRPPLPPVFHSTERGGPTLGPCLLSSFIAVPHGSRLSSARTAEHRPGMRLAHCSACRFRVPSAHVALRPPTPLPIHRSLGGTIRISTKWALSDHEPVCPQTPSLTVYLGDFPE